MTSRTKKNLIALVLTIFFPLWILPFLIAWLFAEVFNGIREQL